MLLHELFIKKLVDFFCTIIEAQGGHGQKCGSMIVLQANALGFPGGNPKRLTGNFRHASVLAGFNDEDPFWVVTPGPVDRVAPADPVVARRCFLFSQGLFGSAPASDRLFEARTAASRCS